ncbi:hypothetical protein NVP1198B_40 [Vibrio phage 1.198.B._10N.286.54.F4]|nr:hypothetical protein NVP1198A_41 [Vibrio phage 1.198.A._10N.286.54.F4]AUR94828.1 hypothetical protein NVP1198B_40 [Vibrio phage 1.198.B._10N.286.54.F4]
MSTYTDELKEVISSFTTNKGEVEVVRISHPNITTLYLTSQLENNTEIYDENDEVQTVMAVPMSLTDESSGSLLLNERTLTLQGINDLVASEEDKISLYESDLEKVKIDVMTYVAGIDGTLSKIALGPIRYFMQKSAYSQKNNNASLTMSTSPTNKSETGEKATKAKFATLQGAEG